MEALAAMWGTIILLARLVLHIGVPIYLYNPAKQERLAQPALWVLFGLFQPITALIAYYLIRFIREELRRSPGENR